MKRNLTVTVMSSDKPGKFVQGSQCARSSCLKFSVIEELLPMLLNIALRQPHSGSKSVLLICYLFALGAVYTLGRKMKERKKVTLTMTFSISICVCVFA